MQDEVAPILNSAVGGLVVGFAAGFSAHPLATSILLVMLAVAAGLLLVRPDDGDRGGWMDGE